MAIFIFAIFQVSAFDSYHTQKYYSVSTYVPEWILHLYKHSAGTAKKDQTQQLLNGFKHLQVFLQHSLVYKISAFSFAGSKLCDTVFISTSKQIFAGLCATMFILVNRSTTSPKPFYQDLVHSSW